jgi:hypothetical protein
MSEGEDGILVHEAVGESFADEDLAIHLGVTERLPGPSHARGT